MSNHSDFESRFQTVVSQLRTNRVLTIISWVAAGLIGGLLLVAVADYFLEMNWTLRAIVFALAAGTAACIALVRVNSTLRRLNRKTTAARVEDRFQDLGQSIRTSVQFKDEPASHGVSSSLLGALNADVQERTEELRLTEAISRGPLKIAILLLCGLAGLITLAAFSSWDWRMAIHRTLLLSLIHI